MADISILGRLVNGIQRNVDLSANTLVTTSIKVGGPTTNTELTKAILDNLVSLQDGSDFSDGTNAHTHDGRYYTETELGDSTASSGSDLIGDDNTYSNFTPAAATVKGALSGIDSAIATAGSTTFSDAEFEIFDDGDNTKKILFQASGIATSTSRTITMPDADVNLGQVNTSIQQDGSRAFTADQSMGGFKLTNLAEPTADTDAATKAYVDAIKQGLDTKESVRAASTANVDLTVAGDGTLDGVTLADNDRVLLKNQTTGSENGIYDAVTASDRTTWVRSADADEDAEVTAGLYTFVEEGTANADSGWVLTTDDPITVGTTSLSFAQFSGAGQITAGDGLAKSGNTLSVNVDDSTTEIVSDTVQVKASSFGTDFIPSGFHNLGTDANAWGTARALTWRAVTTGGVVKIELTNAVTTPSGASGTGVRAQVNGEALNAHTANRSSASPTGDVNIESGNNTGAGDSGDINLQTGTAGGTRGSINLNGSSVNANSTNITNVADPNNAQDAATKAYVDNNVSDGAEVRKTMVAGEAFAADTTFAVRMALDGETAGRVYKADYDASTTDTFYAIGFVQPSAAISAGQNVEVIMVGEITLATNDTAFAAAEIGQPVHLQASGAWDALSQITYSTDQASVRIGMVQETNKILAQAMQLNGIN